MKISIASADWSNTVKDNKNHPVWGGSGWARYGQYVDKLDHEVRAGILISRWSEFGVKTWDEEQFFDSDILFMQRYMFENIAGILKETKGRGQVVINDVDDWYWGLRPSNSAWEASHPKLNPEENINHYSTIIANSTVLTVSTPHLRERLHSKVNCLIELIPNFIDISKFTPRIHTDSELIVGWCGSTAHRSGDLELLAGVLPAMGRDGVKFHHSGDLSWRPQFSEITGVPATTTPMVAPALYPDSFTFDIGLVPLSDTPFNLAKSYIKGLEYAAAGIPFIASNVGEYVRLHDEFGMGRIAKKPGDWKKHVLQLSDPAVRAEEAAKNLEILQQFDIKHGAAILSDLIDTYAP